MDQTYFPSIISFTPTLAVTGVTTTPSLIARFNMELDQTQLNTHLEEVAILNAEVGGAAVPLTLTSYANSTLTLSPSGALTPNETYQITFLRSLKSYAGRQMGANRQFVFQVDTYDIGQVTLLAPADSTAVAIPTFSWEAETWTGGTLEYKIELDVNASFTTVASRGWTTTTSGTSEALGVELPTRTPYFWRVRAESVTGSTVGPWSDARCFYYGSFLTSDVDTRQVYIGTEATQLLQDPLPDPPANLAGFPDLSFEFNRALTSGTITPSTVTLTYRSVDGYPDDREHTVNCSLAVSGSLVTITPADAMQENRRYTVRFLRGITDIDGRDLTPAAYTFTSWYRPHYLGIDVLHADFGALLADMPDDVLHFHIFRNSLEVNRYFLFYDSRYAGGPTQQTVRNYLMPAQLATYPMEKYVENATVAQLLTMKMRDLLSHAGQMERLADYTMQTSSEIIKEYRTAINEASRAAQAYKAEWARHWAKPEAALFGNFGAPIYDVYMEGHRRGLNVRSLR